jgi:hypothetical protein
MITFGSEDKTTNWRVNGGDVPLALVHDVEGLVDLVQRVGEGDVLVHLELALEVLLCVSQSQPAR